MSLEWAMSARRAKPADPFAGIMAWDNKRAAVLTIRPEALV